MKCPICSNNNNNSIFYIKEMQQGLREEFEYIECSNCGCLFIKDIPKNMDKYYDISYAPHKDNSTMKNKIIDRVYSMYLTNNKFIKFIQKNNVTPTTKFWNHLISKNIMKKNSAILDVGCGNGKFLTVLKKCGFKDLTGMDLFVDEKNILKGIKLYQSSLEDFKSNRKYDIVISNHAFEHVDNQLKNLKCFEKLIKEDGIIIIRIPIKTAPVWEKYGVNWFQIDAPRHFFLHTTKSFKILCDQTNLIIDKVIFDSYDEIFINCEKYKRDISMRDEEWKTFKLDDKLTQELKIEIRQLNKNKEADQAIFILKLKN